MMFGFLDIMAILHITRIIMGINMDMDTVIMAVVVIIITIQRPQ